jgi:TolB-like protein/Tfp pilus assembly protein PilF
VQSKIAAVLVADIAGYGRLMEASERGTHARLMALRRNVIDPTLDLHAGRIIKRTGDGLIAIFEIARTATLCAIAVQKEIERKEANEPPEWRIRFRMGLHVGDVIEEAEDVYGNAVNIAARLQELAEPGAVVISVAVRDQAAVDPATPVIDLGLVRLKNIETPVHIFRVATGITPAQPRPTRVDPRRAASIAILPFRTPEAELEQAYFGEGLVEDIIGAIAGLEDLLVISRNSTLAYRDKSTDTRRIGDDLGVRYLLSGSVRRSPRFLRVHAELATTDDGAVIWAQSFDAEIGDLFELQDHITAQIVGMIAPRIRAAEIERAFLKRPDSMDAYDHFLQALSLLFRLERADFANAGLLLRRAIALDDSYATSYALAAEWHGLRIGQGWSPDPEADRREALRLAQAAVDRDANNIRAITLLAHYKSYLFKDYDGALALFNRALNVSPNNAWAWGLSAPTHSYIGDGHSAIARTERALRLSPRDLLAFYYHTSLCIAHYTIGAYEEAAQWGQIALSENPRFTAAAWPTAAALGAMGKKDAAGDIIQILLRVNPQIRASVHAARYPYRDPARRRSLEQHLLAAGLPP